MAGWSVISELEAVIDQEPVDEVFIALPRNKYGLLVDHRPYAN
jgi:hypothetical protein